MATPHPADYMDWCIVCDAPAVVEDISAEQIGYEEQAETVVVLWLSCGHHATSTPTRMRFR